MDIATISEPITGEKKYQKRARAALPLLIRQAQAGVPIFYSDLAKELGMANPRNLDYVLGSIGNALKRLSQAWKEKVPPIQCLVINKNTHLPGEGIGWFLDGYEKMSLRQQREFLKGELTHIYTYRRWVDVLRTFNLTPVKKDFSPIIRMASAQFGGGESNRHKNLKEYVAKNPQSIGLKDSTPSGTTEYPLPSGDSLDVSFYDKKIWVATEVKSAISPEADIIRGLFQCIKYRAVMEAQLLSLERPQNARVLLVLESDLPKSLVDLKNVLGIEVVENVTPTNHSKKKSSEDRHRVF